MKEQKDQGSRSIYHPCEWWRCQNVDYIPVQGWRGWPSLPFSYLRQPCFPQALWSLNLHTLTCNCNYDHIVWVLYFQPFPSPALLPPSFLAGFPSQHPLIPVASKYVNTYFGSQLPNTSASQLDSSEFIRQLIWSRWLKRKMSHFLMFLLIYCTDGSQKELIVMDFLNSTAWQGFY